MDHETEAALRPQQRHIRDAGIFVDPDTGVVRGATDDVFPDEPDDFFLNVDAADAAILTPEEIAEALGGPRLAPVPDAEGVEVSPAALFGLALDMFRALGRAHTDIASLAEHLGAAPEGYSTAVAEDYAPLFEVGE